MYAEFAPKVTSKGIITTSLDDVAYEIHKKHYTKNGITAALLESYDFKSKKGIPYSKAAIRKAVNYANSH